MAKAKASPWAFGHEANQELSPWAGFNLTALADFDFVVGEPTGLGIGLKNEYPPSLKRAVLAALLSNRMGLRSIDYTLKTYVETNAYEQQDETLGFKINRFLDLNITAAGKEYVGFTGRKIIRLGDQIADVNMMRINASLQAAKLLANRGLLFETQCLVRFILEQFAWCHKCHSLDDEDAILALQSKECVGEFKKVYPMAGRLYGHLSDIAHWDPNHHHLFVKSRSGGWTSVLSSSQFMAIGLCYVLLAFDMYHALIEKFYPDGHMKLKVFVATEQFENNRRTKKLVEKVAAKFPDDKELSRVVAFFA
jgi:hypothetical protein